RTTGALPRDLSAIARACLPIGGGCRRRPGGVRQGGGAGRYRGCIGRPRQRGRSSSWRRPAPPGSGEACPRVAGMEPRLRAVCDLGVAEAREGAGRHEYDGRLQDLSPGGVRRGLAALGGDPLPDPYDEALVAAQEAGLRAFYGELRLHRRNPMPHLANLDVSGYDREYAPAGQRSEARTRHLASWPAAVDGSVAALDEMTPAIATATLSAARGLSVGLDADDPVESAALAAHARLVAHLEAAAGSGDGSGDGGDGADGALGPAALGADGLTLLLSATEATDVDLTALAARAEAERDRLRAMLDEACGRLA